MKPVMFFLINSIDLVRGGLTKASLKQASFFAEMGYDTYMLTFNFNPNYPFIREKLIELNKVHKGVIIRNMYEELEGHNQPLFPSIPPETASLSELSNGHPYEQRNGHNAYRVFQNGLYYKYISLNNNNSLNFIDYFNENRYRVRRETYDPWGKLKKIAYMDLQSNKPRQLIYFNDEERAYLSQWNNPTNDSVQRIILFNNDGSVKKSFVNDDVSHKIEWLTKVINETVTDKAVVVSDTRSTDEVLINFNHKRAAKVWRLHSSHLDKPYTVDAPITSKVKYGLDNIDSFNAAIFLTEEQRKDVENRLGEKSNFQVIPHYHEHKTKEGTSLFRKSPKDDKLGVIVSRLSSLKRINHTIKAFRKVVDEIPEVRLEIWGVGDQQAKLEQLISELNLNENVLLKGYAHNPDIKYKKGLFSLLTSKKEGFALSVLESMYNETPVISYNVKYGPSDMIVNNENGFLVEDGEIESLASKMLYMFRNPKIAKDMGRKAKKYVEKNFNKEVYKEKWLNVVSKALEDKFN